MTQDSTQRLLEELEIVKGQLFDINKENDSLKKEVESLKNENSTLVEEISGLRQRETITYNKINDIEQYSRRNNIRILGLKDSKAETYTDTGKCVQELIRNKLGLKQFEHKHIDIAHRVGPYRPNSDRPVIVRFNSHNCAQTVLLHRRILKGSSLVITEDLTRINAARLRHVRDLDCVTNSWSKGGDIFVKNKYGFVTKVDKKENMDQLSKRFAEKRVDTSRQHSTPHHTRIVAHQNNTPQTASSPGQEECQDASKVGLTIIGDLEKLTKTNLTSTPN